MNYSDRDPLSNRVFDRRHEVGLSGYLMNAGRVAARGGILGDTVRAVGKLFEEDRTRNSPLPAPTKESMKHWQSQEDMYKNEDIYGFGEQQAVSQMQQLRSLAKGKTH